MLVPGVGADFVVESIDAPRDHIPPEIAVATVNITLAVECMDLEETLLLAAADGDPMVTVTFQAADGLRLTGDTQALMPTAACRQTPDATVRAVIQQQATFVREALAFKPHEVTLTARLPAGAVREALTAEGSFTLIPGYVARLELLVESKLVDAGSARNATATLQVANLGNGVCQPAFDVVTRPSSASTIAFPAAVPLQPAGVPGDRQRLAVLISDLAGGHYEQAWSIQATCDATEGPGPSQPVTATFLVRHVGGDAPGVPATPAGFLVAVLALAAARRRA